MATWQNGDYAFIGSQAVGRPGCRGGVIFHRPDELGDDRSLGVISVQVSTLKQQVDQEPYECMHSMLVSLNANPVA